MWVSEILITLKHKRKKKVIVDQNNHKQTCWHSTSRRMNFKWFWALFCNHDSDFFFIMMSDSVTQALFFFNRQAYSIHCIMLWRKWITQYFFSFQLQTKHLKCYFCFFFSNKRNCFSALFKIKFVAAIKITNKKILTKNALRPLSTSALKRLS